MCPDTAAEISAAENSCQKNNSETCVFEKFEHFTQAVVGAVLCLHKLFILGWSGWSLTLVGFTIAWCFAVVVMFCVCCIECVTKNLFAKTDHILWSNRETAHSQLQE